MGRMISKIAGSGHVLAAAAVTLLSTACGSKQESSTLNIPRNIFITCKKEVSDETLVRFKASQKSGHYSDNSLSLDVTAYGNSIGTISLRDLETGDELVVSRSKESLQIRLTSDEEPKLPTIVNTSLNMMSEKAIVKSSSTGDSFSVNSKASGDQLTILLLKTDEKPNHPLGVSCTSTTEYRNL